MIFYFVRHGETDWNRKHLFQGRTDIPLNENGRKVAELTREGLREVAFDIAFCSPLCRAKETAEIILQGRDIKLIEDDVTTRVTGESVDCCMLLLKTLEHLIEDGDAPDGFASFVISRMVTLV